MKFERKARYSGRLSLKSFKAQFNISMANDIKRETHRFLNEGSGPKLNKLIAFYGILFKEVFGKHYTANNVSSLD